MLVVEKYGGSSLNSLAKIKILAKHLKKEVKNNKIIVVLSAMGNTTNSLLKLTNKISKIPSRREVDQILSTGEQISVSLASIALNDLGVKAISLNAQQCEIISEGIHEFGIIVSINKIKILKYLEEYDVLFITGFQGIDINNDYYTLGRGASDTTALALASVMQVECRIYKDIKGVYAVDPKYGLTSKHFKSISHELMMEIASLGSGILMPRSVVLASDYSVNLGIYQRLTKEGTKVVSSHNLEKIEVASLAVTDNLVLISYYNLDNVFDILDKNGIKIDMFSYNIGYSFLIERKNLDLFKSLFNKSEFSINEDLIKISLIGNGIASSGRVLSKLLSYLNKELIYPKSITTSELAVSFIISSSLEKKLVEEIALLFNLLE